jgi:hypothetical protein
MSERTLQIAGTHRGEYRGAHREHQSGARKRPHEDITVDNPLDTCQIESVLRFECRQREVYRGKVKRDDQSADDGGSIDEGPMAHLQSRPHNSSGRLTDLRLMEP